MDCCMMLHSITPRKSDFPVESRRMQVFLTTVFGVIKKKKTCTCTCNVFVLSLAKLIDYWKVCCNMRVLANAANGNNRRACFVFLTHKLNVVNLNGMSFRAPKFDFRAKWNTPLDWPSNPLTGT